MTQSQLKNVKNIQNVNSFCNFPQIAAIFVLALAAPAMSYPQYYYGQGAAFYAPQPYFYTAPTPAPAPAPTAAPKPASPADLRHLKVIHERTKPLVDQAEALANEVFPNDGAPVVQDGAIRTKYGEF